MTAPVELADPILPVTAALMDVTPPPPPAARPIPVATTAPSDAAPAHADASQSPPADGRLHGPNGNGFAEGPGCTAAQMRRFIKSRPWVPMHELRRRFAIDGGDDDVTLVDVDRQRLFVGLPEREGRLLGDLLRAGDVGFELATDPGCPIVIGVFPMRPVPRA